MINQDRSTAIADSSNAALVEALLDIQGVLSSGAPIQNIHQAIVDSAVRLLRVDSGALRSVDRADPSWAVAVAAHGGGR